MNDWNDAEQRVEKAQELFEQHRWQEALEELQAATAHQSVQRRLVLQHRPHPRRDGPLRRSHRRLPPGARNRPQRSAGDEPPGRRSAPHRPVRRSASRPSRRSSRSTPPSSPPTATASSPTANWAITKKPRRCSTSPGCTASTARTAITTSAAAWPTRSMFDKAIYCWQKTLDLDERHPDVRIRIADAYWKKGELEAARQHFLAGLRQDPGNTEALLDLGELLLEMGQVDEAGEKFRRAIELSPEDPSGYFCHGRWLMRHGPRRRSHRRLRPKRCSSIRLTPARICGWANCISASATAPKPANTCGPNCSCARKTRRCCWTCPIC